MRSVQSEARDRLFFFHVHKTKAKAASSASLFTYVLVYLCALENLNLSTIKCVVKSKTK